MFKRKKIYVDNAEEIERLYDEIIEDFTNLLKEMGFDDAFSVFEAFCFSYQNGYLSKGEEPFFQFSKACDYDYHTHKYIDVINGFACCRHIATMYGDILEKLEIENVEYDSYEQEVEEEKLLLIQRILLLLDPNRMLEKIICPFSGNHQINLVEYNKKMYLVDPTNHIDYAHRVESGVAKPCTIFMGLRGGIKYMLKKKKFIMACSDDYNLFYSVINQTHKKLIENEKRLEAFHNEHLKHYNRIIEIAKQNGNQLWGNSRNNQKTYKK